MYWLHQFFFKTLKFGEFHENIAKWLFENQQILKSPKRYKGKSLDIIYSLEFHSFKLLNDIIS